MPAKTLRRWRAMADGRDCAPRDAAVPSPRARTIIAHDGRTLDSGDSLRAARVLRARGARTDAQAAQRARRAARHVAAGSSGLLRLAAADLAAPRRARARLVPLRARAVAGAADRRLAALARELALPGGAWRPGCAQPRPHERPRDDADRSIRGARLRDRGLH